MRTAIIALMLLTTPAMANECSRFSTPPCVQGRTMTQDDFDMSAFCAVRPRTPEHQAYADEQCAAAKKKARDAILRSGSILDVSPSPKPSIQKQIDDLSERLDELKRQQSN